MTEYSAFLKHLGINKKQMIESMMKRIPDSEKLLIGGSRKMNIAVKKSFDEDLYFDDKSYILKGCITGIVNRTPQHVDWHNPDNSYPGEEDVDDKSVRTELECFEVDEDGNEKEVPVPASVLDYAMDKFYTSYEEAPSFR